MSNPRIPANFNWDFKKNQKPNTDQLAEIANLVNELANQNDDDLDENANKEDDLDPNDHNQELDNNEELGNNKNLGDDEHCDM